MTFEELKSKIDADLGLGSIVYSDSENHRYLEYASPTGVVLFTLNIEQVDNHWKVRLIGDLLSGFGFLTEEFNDDGRRAVPGIETRD